jgi:hypothetical protein
MPTRRRTTRRRNPVRASESVYARLAKAAALPFPPPHKLEALSDDALTELGNAYERLLISLKGDIEEEETPSGYEQDDEYLAAARPVYAELKDYLYHTVAPIENVRYAKRQKAWREEQEAAAEAKRQKKLLAAQRKAEKAAAKEAAAGIITADLASPRYHLGDEVRGPKGWYEITAIGDNDAVSLKAALAAGIADKRVHSGSWVLLEESDATGPKRDALLVSIGKGPKRNPRRRTVRQRKNSMGADAMFYALQKARIPWSKMSRAQIEDVMQDAAQHGDAKLYARAKAALARR